MPAGKLITCVLVEARSLDRKTYTPTNGSMCARSFIDLLSHWSSRLKIKALHDSPELRKSDRIDIFNLVNNGRPTNGHYSLRNAKNCKDFCCSLKKYYRLLFTLSLKVRCRTFKLIFSIHASTYFY